MPEVERVPQLLADLVETGFRRAGERLSQLLGLPLEIEHAQMAFVPLQAGTGVFGDERTEVVAIHTAFDGDLSGQVLLLLSQEDARYLAICCIGEQAAADGALLDSVLSEIGNIAGSSVLNTAADRFGFTVAISPPEVVVDMAGAVLGSVLPMAESLPDQVLLVQTEFRGAAAGVSGLFLVLPDRRALELLAELLGGTDRG